MEANSAPVSYKPNAFFFLLHVVLVFSLLSGVVLTLSILVNLIIPSLPSVENFVKSAAFQTSVWVVPVFLIVETPIWIVCAVGSGLFGVILTSAARRGPEFKEETKYISWTFASALYNLILVGAFSVVSFVFYAVLIRALSSRI